MSRSTSARVVHISTVHPTFDQRIFHRECVTLADNGFTVTLIVHADHSGDRDGVRLTSLGPLQSGPFRLRVIDRLRETKKALRLALSSGGDVYHIHDPELLPVALALKRKTGARVIYDCHEDNVGYALQKTYIPRPLRRSIAALVSFYEKRAATRLDAVVTADEGLCRRFERLGAHAVTVYNFPRLDLFHEAPDVEKSFDLVYHGSLPRYHIQECFAIDDALLRRGRRVRWLLFGRFDDLRWAQEQVAARGATQRFVLGGAIPAEQVAASVATARIGIIPLPDLPKFQHNIPTKLFEFMALGLPVVLSDLPPSRPFVGDGKCAVMVPPSDAEAYAEAIIGLLDRPERRREMGEEGRRRVMSRYNWSSEGEKLVGLYRGLLEPRCPEG
jgi:glycosyltransferase involved in cell wall biosynthesis